MFNQHISVFFLCYSIADVHTYIVVFQCTVLSKNYCGLCCKYFKRKNAVI